jgi:hypothetical protein
VAFLEWPNRTGTGRTGASAAMGRRPVFRPHSLLTEVGQRAFGNGSLPGVERRFHAQLWKALTCRTADLNRVRRIGSQRDCRQTNGEEATDEMEPAHCPEFPRRPDSRAERYLRKCIPAVAPGISTNSGSVPGPGRSLITPQLCMLSTGRPTDISRTAQVKYAPPSASGVRVTRHPQTGTAGIPEDLRALRCVKAF